MSALSPVIDTGKEKEVTSRIEGTLSDTETLFTMLFLSFWLEEGQTFHLLLVNVSFNICALKRCPSVRMTLLFLSLSGPGAPTVILHSLNNSSKDSDKSCEDLCVSHECGYFDD